MVARSDDRFHDRNRVDRRDSSIAQRYQRSPFSEGLVQPQEALRPMRQARCWVVVDFGIGDLAVFQLDPPDAPLIRSLDQAGGCVALETA